MWRWPRPRSRSSLLVARPRAVDRPCAACGARSPSSSATTSSATSSRTSQSLDSQVRNLREAVEILTDQLDEHKRHLDHALTNRAIVRYDAFRDAGGEQSASFALLDNYRSGVVFSAIAARDFARIYVKHLSDGVADRDLSPEEQQAVAAAVPRPLAAGEDGPRGARAPAAPTPPGRGAGDAGERRAAGDSRPATRRRRLADAARPRAGASVERRRTSGRAAAAERRTSRLRLGDRRPPPEPPTAVRATTQPPQRRRPACSPLPGPSDSLDARTVDASRGDSRVAQTTGRVAFLGPEGTFTEEALLGQRRPTATSPRSRTRRSAR